jgi:hypothetical protein
MSAASNYAENLALNYLLTDNTEDVTRPTAWYLALFTNVGEGSNTAGRLEEGTLTDEISTSGTAYAREVIAFNDAVSGTCSSDGTVTFDAATANWGTITHVAVMDAATAGNVLFYGAVTTPKTIETGDTFQVTDGNLTVSLA